MIEGWLAEGKCVIVDRYVYSNIGYQCAKVESVEERKALREWILKTEYEEFMIPKPTLSLFLDVPFGFTEAKLTSVREGADRDYLGGGQDIHEKSLDLQRRVREVYLEAARADEELQVVDCSNAEGGMASPEEIFQRVVEYVKPLL
jgi:dTMP kinase